jgi:hypothetical protein
MVWTKLYSLDELEYELVYSPGGPGAGRSHAWDRARRPARVERTRAARPAARPPAAPRRGAVRRCGSWRAPGVARVDAATGRSPRPLPACPAPGAESLLGSLHLDMLKTISPRTPAILENWQQYLLYRLTYISNQKKEREWAVRGWAAAGRGRRVHPWAGCRRVVWRCTAAAPRASQPLPEPPPPRAAPAEKLAQTEILFKSKKGEEKYDYAVLDTRTRCLPEPPPPPPGAPRLHRRLRLCTPPPRLNGHHQLRCPCLPSSPLLRVPAPQAGACCRNGQRVVTPAPASPRHASLQGADCVGAAGVDGGHGGHEAPSRPDADHRGGWRAQGSGTHAGARGGPWGSRRVCL